MPHISIQCAPVFGIDAVNRHIVGLCLAAVGADAIHISMTDSTGPVAHIGVFLFLGGFIICAVCAGIGGVAALGAGGSGHNALVQRMNMHAVSGGDVIAAIGIAAVGFIPHHVEANAFIPAGNIRALISVSGAVILETVEQQARNAGGDLTDINVIAVIGSVGGHANAGPYGISIAAPIVSIDIRPHPVILEIDRIEFRLFFAADANAVRIGMLFSNSQQTSSADTGVLTVCFDRVGIIMHAIQQRCHFQGHARVMIDIGRIKAVEDDLQLCTGRYLDHSRIGISAFAGITGCAILIVGHVVDRILPISIRRHDQIQCTVLFGGPVHIVALVVALFDHKGILAKCQFCGIFISSHRNDQFQGHFHIRIGGIGKYKRAGIVLALLIALEYSRFVRQHIGLTVMLQGHTGADSRHRLSAKAAHIIHCLSCGNRNDRIAAEENGTVHRALRICSQDLYRHFACGVHFRICRIIGANTQFDHIACGNFHGSGARHGIVAGIVAVATVKCGQIQQVVLPAGKSVFFGELRHIDLQDAFLFRYPIVIVAKAAFLDHSGVDAQSQLRRIFHGADRGHFVLCPDTHG